MIDYVFYLLNFITLLLIIGIITLFYRLMKLKVSHASY